MESFVISDNAVKKIQSLLQKEVAGSMFSISVEGGGCSGFKYVFGFTDIKKDEDFVFVKDGVSVVIDKMSMENFMKNAELDFVEDLSGSGFSIKNPNSSANCGCGISFSV